MTPTRNQITLSEALERGRQARADAARDAARAIKDFLAARLARVVTA